MARGESPQHEKPTALDRSMELQADRTEIAPTGPPEMAEHLCAAPLRGAVRSAHLQEIAEMACCALAYLTDRLIWPYCLPLMAERCLEVYEEIEGAHEAHRRCAERNAANLILSGLHDHLARLLGSSLLEARDHTPRILGCDFRGHKRAKAPTVAQLAETQKHMRSPWRHWSARPGAVSLLCCAGSAIALLAG